MMTTLLALLTLHDRRSRGAVAHVLRLVPARSSAGQQPTAKARRRTTIAVVISRETTNGNTTTIYEAGGRIVGRVTTNR